MSLIPCPGCSLPRTANDAEFECPVCGFVPGAEAEAKPVPVIAPAPVAVAPRTPARSPVAPTPVDRGGPPLLPWILAGIGFGGTLVCAAGWYLASTDLPHLPEAATTPAPEIAARELAPLPRRASEAPEVASPTPTRPAEVEPKNPWRVEREPVKPAPEVVQAPPLVARPPVANPIKKAEPRPNDGPFEVIRVDAPVEDFRLDPVAGRKRIKLVGVANKLFIASVTEGAVVDATEVQTRWVNVTGRIDDGATLRLAAPSGLVNFTEPVGGGATVVVDVAGGTVTFAKKNPPKLKPAVQPSVSGGARVTLMGRQVTFLGPITDAGTTVNVTLSPRGHLRFVEMDEGAKLVYRQSKPTDPPLIVNPGLVKGDAEFKRVE